MRQKSKISQRSYPPKPKEEIVTAPSCDSVEEPISMIEDEILNHSIEERVPQDDEMPMKSSCVAPDDGGVEAAKEKDERAILEEPMVAKALELFAPKTVRVKRKV